jgi:hypothetical protein
MQYRLQRQTNRLDFFANPSPSPGTRLPTISSIPNAIRKFREQLDASSDAITAINRLAIVVNVSEMTESANVANQRIAELTGIELPFADLSDLLFQANRRKYLTAIPNMQVNRVLKWIAETFQVVEVVSGAFNTQTFNTVTVSVDVNTVPVSGHLFEASEHAAILEAMAMEVERLCGMRTMNALGE